MSECSFPGCTNKVAAAKLCAAHYQQHRRDPDAPLRALRPSGGLVRVTARIPPPVADRLAEQGPTVSAAARAVLERWANGRAK